MTTGSSGTSRLLSPWWFWGRVKVPMSTQDTAVPSMFPLSLSLSAGHPGAQQSSRLLVGPCGHLNVPPMELMFVLLSLKLKWGGPNNNWDRKALGFHFSEFLHLGLMILSKSQLPLQGCFFIWNGWRNSCPPWRMGCDKDQAIAPGAL